MIKILKDIHSKFESKLILNSKFNLNYPPYLQSRLALSHPSSRNISSDYEFELWRWWYILSFYWFQIDL